MEQLLIESENATYTDSEILSSYTYKTNRVEKSSENSQLYKITPVFTELRFKTERKVPKLGVMLVGWGGNNGTTFTGVILANKHKLCWETKKGILQPNYYGSMVKSSTICLGILPEKDSFGCSSRLNVPLTSLLPIVDPNAIEVDGWDINDADMAVAMKRSEVFDVSLQNQLAPYMKDMKPRPSSFNPTYVASNQQERANNILKGSLKENLEQIRRDIKDFKARKQLDKIIVMWTASTERFTELNEIHSSSKSLLSAIDNNDTQNVSPSTLFAVASILEGCTFINGSPQNTIYSAVIELASTHGVHVAGDDFKTGQTKVKSALTEFLINSGIKPVSIVSYNHLGNNDGRNLASYPQFRSKEITKGGVIDDMVSSNTILYPDGEKPDHCIVIKYVPYVGDSKRAMDEYVSEICMHGNNTIAMHNTCEDSLLATTVMIDLVLLTELFDRISVKVLNQKENGSAEFTKMDTVLSALGFLLKAPVTANGEPVVNAFSAQRSCIENLVRACLGLYPETNMLLEFKLPNMKN